jgi:hypothetical protein
MFATQNNKQQQFSMKTNITITMDGIRKGVDALSKGSYIVM